MPIPYSSLRYVGLSGVPDALALSDTQKRAGRATGQLQARGWTVVNNIYTQWFGNHIALRGGQHKPGRDASDAQIDGMRKLHIDGMDDLFHFSPLEPTHCYSGPIALIKRFWANNDVRPVAGFQISQAQPDDNQTWPDQLFRLRVETAALGHAFGLPRLRDGCAVVLQLGPQLIAGLKGNRSEVDPGQLVEWLAPFAASRPGDSRLPRVPVTHVLWDVSGGTGDPINPSEATKALLAIQDAFPELLVGAAGNLSARTMRLLQPLVDAGVRISFIDAASALRDNDDRYRPGRGAGFIEETATWVEKGLLVAVTNGQDPQTNAARDPLSVKRSLVMTVSSG